MTEQLSLLAYGDFLTVERTSLSEAAEASSMLLHTAHSSDDAASWLNDNQPCAILLGGSGPDSISMAVETRAQRRHRKLPILAVSQAPSDLDFTGAFSWGADDVVAADAPWSLTTRLRALSRLRQFSDLPPRGTVVVGEIEQGRRVAMARVLANAGFEVRFAVNAEDLHAFAVEPGVTLVVSCTELCPEPEALLDACAANGTCARFVVSAEPKRFGEYNRRLRARLQARVTDATAPPENVIFLANELSAGAVLDKRTSLRHLFGTTVRFRCEGLEEDDLGFTYNISAGGLYVRTLAPPTEDLVWLELMPPRTARRVRLVGQVAWRRPFGPNGHATVPPGFGVRIVDGAKSDLARWQECCEAAPGSN